MSDTDGEQKELSKIDQAAVLLMSLGEAEAAAILKNMGPKEVQAIGMSMTQLTDVQHTQVHSAVGNMLKEVSGQTSLGVDSDQYIRNVMVKALGEDKANTLVDRIMLGGTSSGLETLKWMDAKTVAEIIRHEHPQIQAIVATYLDPEQSAAVLGSLSEEARLDIITRVANLESVHPSALQELNEILEKQFSGYAKSQSRQMGGKRIAADILNCLDKKIETQLIDGLTAEDEVLGTEIKDMMFIFENLLNVDDRGIQALLREVSSDLLIIAIKGASEELKEKIFSNMSKRAAELLADDLEAKGPVKVAEVEGSQREILGIAHRLSEDGEISLGGSGDDML